MKKINKDTIVSLQHDKVKIYIFGNELVKEDSLSIRLLPELKKQFPDINFIIADPNENFPPKDEKNLIILDTVINIKDPTIFDIDDFIKNKKTPISPHDYDLLFHLLLLKKLKRLNKVVIIGIPPNKSINIIDEIRLLIIKLTG